MAQNPAPDHSVMETRLLVLAEMLDRAAAEVRRLTADVKGGGLDTAGPVVTMQGQFQGQVVPTPPGGDDRDPDTTTERADDATR